MKPDEPLRKQKMARWQALKQERSSWTPRWNILSQYILPFSGRFQSSDHNRGDKSFNNIYDSTGTRAHRVLAAGLMAGMTSPARPWFRLATPDADLMEHAPVKMWLDKTSQLMRDVFARSNTYRAFHTQYEELGCFATAVNMIEDNFDTVMWCHPLTAGEYCIAVDELGRPNTLYREFEMTIEQLVAKFVYDRDTKAFDWRNVSQHVKNLWDTNRFDQWVPILHSLEPREIHKRDVRLKNARNMPVASVYLEIGASEDKVLRESGYKEFPGTISRWHTRGGDVYGHGPGFEAIGDIKQLQHEQFRKGQAIDFMSKPPIELPPDAKANEVEYLPGGVSIGSGVGNRARNLVDVKVQINELLEDIRDVRERVNAAFYVPLFLMISNMPGVQPRNQFEIAERHEEKLLMIGPVLERLHDELLSPHIDMAFAKLVNARVLPPPPPEMQDMELKVEFVSTLAQAQKAVGLGSLDRLLGTVALISQGKGSTEPWDKIDTDQVIDKYSDMLSVDPSVIVSDDKIVVIRESRQAQAAAQQAAAMAKPAADLAAAGKTMSETDPAALNDATAGVMGYT